MSERTSPPFRAEHAGRLPCPEALQQARLQRASGEISASTLRAAEDRAITAAVRFQESIGLKSITDGDLRSAHSDIDFLRRLGGVEATDPAVQRRPQDGTVAAHPATLRIVDKVRHLKDICRADFEFLKRQPTLGGTPKLIIPSPTLLLHRSVQSTRETGADPAIEPAFHDEIARAYGDELRSLYNAGCRHVQMHDHGIARLCGEPQVGGSEKGCETPRERARSLARFVNKLVAQKPPGMILTLHLGRAGFGAAQPAGGQDEAVAEVLLSELKLDALCLDDDETGTAGFEPLRFLAKGRVVVLGLVSTRPGALPSPDALKRRLDEAARHLAQEQLCLSPRSGWGETCDVGPAATPAHQAALRLVVDTAREVWG